jgi:glyoxylate reductase
MQKIFVTHQIHEAGLKLLRDRYDVEVTTENTLAHDDLLKKVKGVDALVSLLTDKIDAEVMEVAGPQLKIIAQFAVGFDNIDLEAAKAKGIVVTNTPGGISGPAVAEHAIMMMFAVARHAIPADTFMRSGKYKQWDPDAFIGRQLTGATVGIIGTGQIGSIFAKMCHNGLGMKVLYTDMNRNEALEKDLGALKVDQAQLLAEADVVSLHVPLLPSTQHLINAEALHMMKPSAILLNTSRGPVVDENALVKALEEKHIFGAGLDVYEFEPKMAEGLAKLENVVTMPHIGSATEAARIGMAECVARNIIAQFSGEEVPNNIIK